MAQNNSMDFIRKVNRKLKLSQWFDRQRMSESAVIMLTAVVVGIAAGLGAVVFRWLIDTMQKISYQGLGALIEGISPYHLMIIPALGGLIYGPLIYRYAREAKGHGVPEVMLAVASQGGRIRPQVAVVKSLASAICIGTGGSVGREGPIAQIGSAVGSTIGQLLNLSDERVRNLVACGAAGGISATFNAPIAGSVFALEIILGQMHATYFGAVVISSVIADVVAHLFEGNLRAFAIPEYALISPWELLFYLLLGICAAMAAVLFTRMLYLSEDLWDKIRFPEYFKPILGGLALGVIGILSPKVAGFPRTFGVGYDSIGEALFGNLAIQMTLALLVLKFLATITTLGAGGSGGVFAPSLFMGAMLGESFGQVVHTIFPAITAPVGAYALVGMAAFFSGAAHAPITSILIIFEMTGDYRIILPLMLATVTSTLIARMLNPESIYTLKLTRRGVNIQEGKDIDVMQGVTVGEVMTTEFETIPLEMPLSELADIFDQTHHHGFAVVDSEGNLAGIVSIRDLDRAYERGEIDGVTVADISTKEDLLVAYEDEPMWRALRRLGVRDVSRLPVVKRDNERRLVGIVRRKDIIKAYNVAMVQRTHHQHHTNIERLGKLVGSNFLHVDIPQHGAVAGKRISELRLDTECLIVSIQRGRKVFPAHGHTVLQPKDRLTVFVSDECALDVRESLTRLPQETETSQDEAFEADRSDPVEGEFD